VRWCSRVDCGDAGAIGSVNVHALDVAALSFALSGATTIASTITLCSALPLCSTTMLSTSCAVSSLSRAACPVLLSAAAAVCLVATCAVHCVRDGGTATSSSLRVDGAAALSQWGNAQRVSLSAIRCCSSARVRPWPRPWGWALPGVPCPSAWPGYVPPGGIPGWVVRWVGEIPTLRRVLTEYAGI